MDEVTLKYLLNRYFEGNSSIEDERRLKEYFRGTVDPEFHPLKKQFNLIEKSRNQMYECSRLESSILSSIDAFESKNRPEPKRKSITMFRIMAAASIALIISLIIFWPEYKNQTKDTFTDPKLAYIETQNALLLISRKMNKGIEPLSNINKINTGTEQLQNLKRMDESMGMLNVVSLINNASNLKK